FAIDLPDKSEYKGFSIRDAEGNAIPYTQTGSESYGTLVRNLQDISLQLRSQRVQLSAEFTDVPAFGYKTYHIKREDQNIGSVDVELNDNSVEPVMENEFIKASINEDGSLNILDKKTGQNFENMNYYEETGESGNPWIHMFPEENQTFLTLGTKADISHVESSEFLTRFKVTNELTVPIGLEGEESNYRRSDETVKMIIDTTYTLRKNQPFVEVHTKINNNAEQHRVRAMFPTKLDVKVSAAEAAFDVIERDIVVPESSPYYGRPTPQYPMHRFVDMSERNVGLAIFNDGIREYEAIVDDERTLALTLFRGFTATQSPVIDQWDVYPWMKLSQSLGENEWKYAIMPHPGNWQEGNIYREVERFNLPFETGQSGKGGGNLPKVMSFISIEPKEIALSTLKHAENRDSLILRLFNPTDKEVEGNIKTFKKIKEAWITNMNEERRDKLAINGNSVSIKFGKKKIVTIEIVLD
ncbi:MAG: hypothetical protein GXO85_14070, partial [Chlorobi bacterium]|nr:hypothetical protein [Chlorobiota bacterium]